MGNLAARGAQLDIERQRLAREAEQNNAAMSLRRDQLQLDNQVAREQRDQQAAGMALRLAAMKQAGLMGQEKLGQGQERIGQSGQSAADKLAETATFHTNETNNAQARNRILASAQAWKQLQDENKNQWSQKYTEDAKSLDRQIMGYFRGYAAATTDKDRTAIQTKIDDLTGQRAAISANYPNKSAASTLTAGTGTNPPAAPAASAPSPNLPANPAASSLSAPGNYSAPQFQAPGTSKGKVATKDIILQALQQSGGDKQSARQWLQDNGYTIPPAQ